MENKNPSITLKNTATLAKFEVLFGQVEEIKTRNRSLERINNALNDEISELKQALQNQQDDNKELRRELRKERIRSNSKVDLDNFHKELASVVNRIEFGDIAVENGLKQIMDALINEVENCIELIQNMQRRDTDEG